MDYPSASLTSRSAPARYAQEGSCPSYALSQGGTGQFVTAEFATPGESW
jgi:hypothetical protein